MKTKYLFPRYFRFIGYGLLLPVSFLLSYVFFLGTGMANIVNSIFFKMKNPDFPEGVYNYYAQINAHSNSCLDEITMILFTATLLFIAFSREKAEDEYTRNIRLNSFLWAVAVNSVLVIISIIFLKEMMFANFMFVNFYLLIVLFIIKMRISVYRMNKLNKNEN
ncbi:MAG: hypothetical protein LUF90_11405 [Rikenellaceae bacterium]|nr:hypothetical protein [Rikenellaceae bacterium]